jgi:hypothetical protein
MLKPFFIIAAFVAMVGGAYLTAQNTLERKADLTSLQIGMGLQQVRELYGQPSARDRNQLTYILPDSSELTITLRDDVVASAKVKYRHLVKVGDPELRQLTLVQMDPAPTDSGSPNWFFAGKPEEGLIYKISAQGIIESITWVPPFSVGHQRPKNVQVLLRDFNSHQLSKM